MDLRTSQGTPGRAAVRVDAAAEVRVVEDGRADDVPSDLRRLAAGAVAADVGELRVVRLGPVPLAVLVQVEDATAVVAVEPLEALPHGLSRRELEVLTLLVAGLTNAAVATRLAIGARTVATHVDRVLSKLDVASRGAAAARALDEGLVVVPPPGGPVGFEQLRLGRAMAAADRTPARRGASPRPVHRRPLRVGALLPLTGVAAADAREMEQGARLAIEELNAAGGVAGRRLELRVADVDPQDATTVAAGFEGLLAADVDVLTSGYLARQDLAHDLAAAAGVPYLHAATSGLMEQRAAEDPGRFSRVFQVCPSDVHYGPHFVDVVSGLRDRGTWRPGSRRLLAVRQPAWDLVDLGLSAAADHAERRGWALTVEAPRAGGWREAGARAAGDDPAAVMIGSYLVDDHVAFVEGFRDAGGAGLLYGIYAPSVPEFRLRLGDRADGILWATTTGTYPDRLGRSFAARYARRFGVVPGRSHAGIAYDRVRLVAGAWAAADFRDFSAVADHLRASVYRGVNGAYSFDAPGQTARTWSGEGAGDPSLAQAHLVHQIQDGHQRVVGPATYADGALVLPPLT
ncbi:ABC transporter substrate-binding protein [Actinomycetospora termitidis]|uniref:ABC transporter substrate-binding protein n=1 Tax=Actinomycetospora termitidis TaxID=3053470 RepID=A0ABT7MIP9_9PSEU|nr:ABC transporter substrate-binding protein [Actinomycetospora sp. Odt1-22]MDL5159782.1 ABC transporter substrate-binding protein [Actinomycetospora sp. Odt1-22]